MGVLDQIVYRIDSPVGDLGSFQALHRLRVTELAKNGLDLRPQRVAVGNPLLVVDTLGLCCKAWVLQKAFAKINLLALVLDRQHQLFAVTTLEAAIGRNSGVFQARAGGGFTAITRLQIRHRHQVGRRVKQRHLDDRTHARGCALQQRLLDGNQGVQS